MEVEEVVVMVAVVAVAAPHLQHVDGDAKKAGEGPPLGRARVRQVVDPPSEEVVRGFVSEGVVEGGDHHPTEQPVRRAWRGTQQKRAELRRIAPNCAHRDAMTQSTQNVSCTNHQLYRTSPAASAAAATPRAAAFAADTVPPLAFRFAAHRPARPTALPLSSSTGAYLPECESAWRQKSSGCCVEQLRTTRVSSCQRPTPSGTAISSSLRKVGKYHDTASNARPRPPPSPSCGAN